MRILSTLILLLTCSIPLAHAQTICDATYNVNQQRIKLGFYPLHRRQDLQKQAEYEAVERARKGITGFLPGGCYPGNAKGVGVLSTSDPQGKHFFAGYHDPTIDKDTGKPRWIDKHYRDFGAAVAVNKHGNSYYVIILDGEWKEVKPPPELAKTYQRVKTDKTQKTKED